MLWTTRQARQLRNTWLKKKCDIMLVQPHNHQVNAAKRAIQTFKAHFIRALPTTNSDFPLQLWDRLTPQVENTLNLMHPSRIDPTKSAYEAIHGPYDWNRFPLAPPGCKAIIYESPESRGSWASRGTNAWYVGPSLDHYRCNHYFVPETSAYRISGSTDLFPQHCQVPFLTWNKNLQEVINELVSTIKDMPEDKQRQVLTLVKQKLATLAFDNDRCITNPIHEWLLPPGDIQPLPRRIATTQRVEHRVEQPATQRVSPTPLTATIPITRITTAPPIMSAPNPTAKRTLKTTLRTHQQHT
jgi:hypothetical protein